MSAEPASNPRSSSEIDVNTLDEVLNRCIGQFGRWQLRVSLLVSLLKFPIAWFQLGIVFLAPPTQFWCRRPPNYENVTVNKWLEIISYNDSRQYIHQSLVHGSCYMRDPSQSLPNSPKIPCISGYEYNTTTTLSSIVTEWDMVCGHEKLIDIAQTVLMFGVLLGTITLGMASDKFGRKPVLVICLVVQAVTGLATALSPNYTLFLLARFITAFANAGTMVSSFVICMEVVGGKWRTIVPILYQIPFGIGNSVMAIIAYFIRDWRELQFILSSLSLLYLVYWRWLPESPRWLLATGRKERAIQVLEKAAMENKKSVPDVRTTIEYLFEQTEKLETNSKLNLSSLFQTPALRQKSILLCIHWLFIGISFYGFSQYMGQVSTHLHLTIMIGGLISLPGTVLCCFIIRKYGRRGTIAGAHLFTAACYFGIMATPQGMYIADWPRIILAAMGVIGLSVSTPAMYLFTGEIFPTVLRNAGLGAALMCSRVGSMIAPFVSALSRFSSWLPLFVLGVSVIIEALLVIPLPETKDCSLPDTINDAEIFGRKNLADDKQHGTYIMVPKEDMEN